MARRNFTYYMILFMLFSVPIFYFKTYLGPMPISIEVITIPLLVLAALWDYKQGKLKLNDLSLKPFIIAFSAFLFVSILSLVKAESYTPAIMEIARYLSYVFLFIIVVKVKFTKEEYYSFAKAFALSALIVGLFGALQYIFNFSLNKAGLYALEEAKGRVDSTLTNPNYYSSFLNFIIPTLFLLTVVYFKNKKVQLLFFAFYALYVANLILTYTRAAWVTMFCALILLILLMPKRIIKNIIKPHLFIAFVLLGVFVYNMPDFQSRTESATFAIQKLVYNTTGGLFGDKDPGEPGDSEDPEEEPIDEDEETTNRAVVSRVTLWKTGWVMFKDNPGLGVGMGNYYVRYKDFVTKYPELDIGHEAYSVHNSYLKVASETGIPGILSFLSIYIVYLLYIARLYFKQNLMGQVAAAGLLIGSITFLVQNLSNNLIFIPQLNVIFWLVAGVTIAFLQLNKTEFK